MINKIFSPFLLIAFLSVFPVTDETIFHSYNNGDVSALDINEYVKEKSLQDWYYVINRSGADQVINTTYDAVTLDYEHRPSQNFSLNPVNGEITYLGGGGDYEISYTGGGIAQRQVTCRFSIL